MAVSSVGKTLGGNVIVAIGKLFAVSILISMSLAACQKTEESEGKGPAELAGKQIDRAAAEAGRELKKAAQDTGKALEKAGASIQEKAQEKSPASSSDRNSDYQK